MKPALNHIVVVGGGSAGWMTAAALSKALNPADVSITLVESDQIGIIGVGEATIPDMLQFNLFLGLAEDELMKATQATFKLGIEFVDWARKGDRYFHPFGFHGVDIDGVDFHQYWLHSRANGNRRQIDDYCATVRVARKNGFAFPDIEAPGTAPSFLRYAYHLDASLYARFLRDYAERRGVKRVEGKISEVLQDGASGDIAGVKLESGAVVEGDFFFDCSGFRSLLFEKKFGVEMIDWSHWLPCNSAIAVASQHAGPLTPYTRSAAKSAGWQWRIPTQQRTGNGHIYSSEFMSEDEATSILLSGLDGEVIGSPRLIPFKTGHRRVCWKKNCIAIGLSSGFLEPLESTSLYLIRTGISRFIDLFPDATTLGAHREEYNKQMQVEFEQVRDLLVLHYSATERDDSPFWNYCRNMQIPDTLAQRIALFRESGRYVHRNGELFGRPSWVAVMLGQHVLPETIDPAVASLPHTEVDRKLELIRNAFGDFAETVLPHAEVLARYCPAR